MNNFAINLKFLLKENNLTQEMFGEILSKKRSVIGSYLRGETQPSIENLIKIADYFGIDLNHLVCVDLTLHYTKSTLQNPTKKSTGRTKPKTHTSQQTTIHRRICMLDSNAVRVLPYQINNQDFFDNLPYFHFPEPIFEKEPPLAIQQTNDSMHPTLLHGDFLISRPISGVEAIKNGHIYVVVTDTDIHIQRLYLNRTNLHCTGDNNAFGDFELALEEIRRIYRVDGRLSFNLHNPNANFQKEIKTLKNQMQKVLESLKK